jgi:HAE1 family hydrophobic/amphiphilic exporter-1
MTSFAFIAGLLPLVFTGPGKIGNRTIGTAAGGMLIGTICGVFVIPGLYYIFGRIAEIQAGKSEEENPLKKLITMKFINKKLYCASYLYNGSRL